MSARLTRDGIQNIRDIVDRHSDGATLREIAQALSPAPDERTLQNWLAKMQEGQCVRKEGDGANALYFAVEAAPGPGVQPAASSTETSVTPDSSRPDSDGPTAGNGGGVPPGSPKPTSEGGSPRDSEAQVFSQLYESVMPQIVAAGMTMQAMTVTLLNQAAKNNQGSAATKAYIAYAKRRLAALSADDVVDYGITAERFATWWRRYTGAAEPAIETADPSEENPPTDRAETPAAAEPLESAEPPTAAKSRRKTNTRPRDEDFPAAQPSAPPDRRAGSAASEIAEAKEAAGEIALLMVKTLQLGSVIKRGVQIVKESMTVGRAAFTLIWPIVVLAIARQLTNTSITHLTTSSIQSYIYLTKLVGVIVIAVSGLPWLFFHWRDVRKSEAPGNGQPSTAGGAPGRSIDWAAVSCVVALVGFGSNQVAQFMLGIFG